MAEFPGLPENPYEYVNRFDYSVWTAGTTIQCCVVPWDASYRDVVRFASEEDKAAWFQRAALEGATGFTLSGLVYLKAGEPVRLPVPFSQVNQCNYLVVRNPEQPVPSRVSGRPERIPDTFYYFVTDVRYLAPNCTELSVQLDVWMTYGERLAYGLSFVARGHAGIANEASGISNIADYLTDPEGLDYGAEYDIVHQEFINFLTLEPWILVVSTADLASDWGSVSSPHLTTAGGSFTCGFVSGCAVYGFSAESFRSLMAALSQAPWVSQCITYITAVPQQFVTWGAQIDVHGVTGYTLASPPPQSPSYSVGGVMGKFSLPERYQGLYKLYSSPYCLLEITALTGGGLVVKPEFLSLDNGAMTINTRACMTPPDVRIMAWPGYYNKGAADGGFSTTSHLIGDFLTQEWTSGLEGGENMDMALTIGNFPQINVVNNGYMLYMANSNYTRNYQYSAADWARERAMYGANVARGQAVQGMGAQSANNRVSNQLAWQQNAIAQQQNAWGGVQGVVGGLASGNLLGAAGTALTAGVDAALNSKWMTESTSNQVAASQAQLANSLAAQSYSVDTNYALASYNASRDYHMQISAIEAQVQDARLTQPSVSGQNGGDCLNWSNGYVGLLVKWKRPKQNHLVQLGEYFLRYGYIVNRWIHPPRDLCLMDKFTYWEIQDPQVFGEVPEVFKQTVRGILSAGVTVWTSPDLIGRTDFADNAPKGGFSY